MKKSINNTFSAFRLHRSAKPQLISVFNTEKRIKGIIFDDMTLSMDIKNVNPSELHELADFIDYLIKNIDNL